MTSVFDEQRGRVCTVCYHQFSCHGDAVPRILMCGHSFCTGCLSRLLGQLAHGHIRCPTCKGDTLVPGLSNDINKLSKNFGVLEILEGIEEGTKVTPDAANPFPLCSNHDNEPMKVFCIQDDQLICIYCQVYGAHQGHQCQLVTILAQESRKTIRSFIERLSNQKDSMVAVGQVVNDTTAAVQIKENRLMYEMTRHFQLLRRKLHQRENQVKILLKNRISAKVMLLSKQQKKLRDLMSKVDQLNASCQSVLTCPDYEIVQQRTKLENDFQSLSSSIEERDLRPCTKDDLHCHLDPSMLVQVSSHGMLVKEPVYRPQPDVVAPEPNATTSAAVASPVGESVGSGGDADRPEGGSELEWPAIWPSEEENSHRGNRQQSSQSDVIILYDDMDLEPTASSSFPNAATYPQQQPSPSRPARRSQSNAQRTCHGATGSSSRRSQSQNEKVVRKSAYNFLRSVFGPDQAPENANANQYIASSSDDEDCPELSASELSDMELERPLRSAWTNRGGWSTGAAMGSSIPQADHGDPPSVLLEGAAGGVVGDASSGVGTAEVDGDGYAQGASEEAVIVVQSGSDTVQAGEVEERRSEGNSPRRGRRQAHSLSHYQRYKAGLMCSVLNCTTTNCNFYVRCKNCSRLFCQKCVTTSISARRCYKRPRGHSFMYIPMNTSSTSANSNQRLHQLMHFGDMMRNRCLRQHDHLPGSRPATAEMRTQADTDSWYCVHCWTENWPQSGSRRCVSCGQVNECPPEVDQEIELMTFPPSPDASVPSSSGAGDGAQGAEGQLNPTSATTNQEAEVSHDHLDAV